MSRQVKPEKVESTPARKGGLIGVKMVELEREYQTFHHGFKRVKFVKVGETAKAIAIQPKLLQKLSEVYNKLYLEALEKGYEGVAKEGEDLVKLCETIWLPKSQITVNGNVIEMPEWLWKKNFQQYF
jgi:hypothetical protein